MKGLKRGSRVGALLEPKQGEGVSDDAVSCGGMHDVAVRVV